MATDIVEPLARSAAVALVFVFFAFARKRFPAQPAKGAERGWSIEELSSRFAFTQWIVNLGMVVVGLVVAFGIHGLLVDDNRFLVKRDGPAAFVIFPEEAIWWFLPGFAALTFAWEITLWVWSLLGDRREAALYNYWTTAKAGFDSTRILRWIGILIVLPIGILTVLAIPVHTSLQGDVIHVSRYAFAEPRTYRYSDARRMAIVKGFRNRDGKLTRRAGIVIDFADGRRWSSNDIGEFRREVDPALVEFLHAKTGLEPQYAETASDLK